MEDLEKIKRLLTKYIENNDKIQFEAEYYLYSAELYRRIQARALGDIYILDMIMDGKTGIDIGALIRSIDKRSIIIYITSSDDFALEAYGVHAVRYLLKPVQEELFVEALDYAAADISRTKSFLVNLCHVDRLTPGNVLMKSGANIPVSKTRTADVKKEYLKFISEQYQ